MSIFKVVYQDIKEHALASSPMESCGLVINFKGKLLYHRCINIYPGLDNFVIRPEDYMEAEDKGDVVAVVHSHVNHGAVFSKVDIASMNKGSIPWILYSIPEDMFIERQPSKVIEDYINREYIYSVQDCYSLIQDYYLNEFQIVLPAPPYQNPLDSNLGSSQGFYQLFESYGFEEIKLLDLRPGDCIIMCNNSTLPNHAAIYLGENIILHHPANRLSCRNVYGGYWMKNTWKCVRHRNFINHGTT